MGRFPIARRRRTSITPPTGDTGNRKGRPTGYDCNYSHRARSRLYRPSYSSLATLYLALHERWFVGPRQVQKIVKRVAERARISQNVTPHVLRHTFATMALQKGISLAAVQKILGHERLGTTALYLNLTDLHVVEEYAQQW